MQMELIYVQKKGKSCALEVYLWAKAYWGQDGVNKNVSLDWNDLSRV